MTQEEARRIVSELTTEQKEQLYRLLSDLKTEKAERQEENK